MTLAQIKAMFQLGQRWHGIRNCSHPEKVRNEMRTVVQIRSREVVFELPNGTLWHTQLPKASEVKEARPGFLRFGYAFNPDIEVILTLETV